MNVDKISMVSVSYNTPELIEALLSSFRQHYNNPVTIVDGSDEQNFAVIANICARYVDVNLKHFDYNIHHGPGLAWAFQNLHLQGPLLILDSDIVVLKQGFLEKMCCELTTEMYGVGCVQHVNAGGRNVPPDQGFPYLHPACMLCNMEIVRRWPMPTKHGAPMIEAMRAIYAAGQAYLLKDLHWIGTDFSKTGGVNEYLQHDWQGTVKRTGGYHLEEWMVNERNMQATAVSTTTVDEPRYNRDLIQLIPATAQKIIEIGCNNGALARAYKQEHPDCTYIGVEIDARHAELARRHCDTVYTLDIEADAIGFFDQHSDADTWIFGDVLEHLRDPWGILARIRKTLTARGCIVICLPNVQHWSVQAKLSIGDFHYQDWGLLDRTHLRFFTRITMLEMVTQAGFGLQAGYPRILGEVVPPGVTSAIKAMATAMGKDPEQAYQDSLPTQYVLRIVPA